MRIKIFADGADLASMKAAHASGRVQGFTTNPTLMRQAGVTDYQVFAREVLKEIRDLPVSFEVFADDFEAMGEQARLISSWGDNVYVKIPVTNTLGQSSADLVRELSASGVQVNVTALLTLEQVDAIAEALHPTTPAVVSVFAGRIADTGMDPAPIMSVALERLQGRPMAELLWASPREVLNIYQAAEIGCHIITVSPDLLAKLALKGKDLAVYSLETVAMFRRDAIQAGYSL